jgi:predicted GNAT family acetyltransferase
VTTIEIRHDEARRKFVLETNAGEAYLLYAPAGEGTLDFQSTFVPPEARGRFLGSRVVRHALDYARANGLKVVPSCWFVGSVVERHPEYRALLAG